MLEVALPGKHLGRDGPHRAVVARLYKAFESLEDFARPYNLQRLQEPLRSLRALKAFKDFTRPSKARQCLLRPHEASKAPEVLQGPLMALKNLKLSEAFEALEGLDCP